MEDGMLLRTTINLPVYKGHAPLLRILCNKVYFLIKNILGNSFGTCAKPC